MTEERPPDSDQNQDPARFDPWAGNHFGGARFFAVSTVVHIALLLIFAGVSLTVIRSVQTIPVKIEEVGIETEGQPSTEDYAGLLEVTKAPRRDAQRPQGPIVRNVKAPRVPTLASVGPKLGTGPAVDINTAALTLGGGGIGGLGGSFGDYVGGLRKTGLDLVLVIDTTETSSPVSSIAAIRSPSRSTSRRPRSSSGELAIPTSRHCGSSACQAPINSGVAKCSSRPTSFISAMVGADSASSLRAGPLLAVRRDVCRARFQRLQKLATTDGQHGLLVLQTRHFRTPPETPRLGRDLAS